MFTDTSTDWSVYILVRFWQSAVFHFTYMHIFSYYALISLFIGVLCKTFKASNFQWLKENIKRKEKVHIIFVWISITVE